MEMQARFIIRPDKRKNLILGVNFKNSKLKSNTIYEIQEIMGEYILKEIGKPIFDKKNWGYDISTIVETFEGTYVLTKKELKK